MEEGPRVLAVRAAVDLHHKRPLALRVEAVRLQQPAFQLQAIGGGELPALGRRQRSLAEKVVAGGQPALVAGVADEDVARRGRVGGGERDRAPGQAPVEHLPVARNLGPQLAAGQVAGPELGAAREGDGEDDPGSVLAPGDLEAVAAPHVGDAVVADADVVPCRDAALVAAGGGDEPEARVAAGRHLGAGEHDRVAPRRPRHHVQEVCLHQVVVRLCVAVEDQAPAVGRPVEAAHVPPARGQLQGLPAIGRDHE